MHESQRPDLEELVQAQVAHSLARYVGKVPPYQLAKLRDLAERYWREHPDAAAVLRGMSEQTRLRSGLTETVPTETLDAAAGGEKG